MTTVAASSLRPDVDLEMASHHLELLHRGAPGFGSLVLLGNDRHERHAFFETLDLVHRPDRAHDAREALQDVVDARWNVYTALSTFAQAPEKGRGTRADVLSVPGVWADLDVKPDTEGYFGNEIELMSYVQWLPQPTIEVASGSGGRHLYWLTHERLESDHGQRLLLWWLDFLRQEAGTHIIENVHDTTRILRLAGTVRWPKVADAQEPMPRPVELIAEGPRYHVQELETLARDAHDKAQALRDEARARRQQSERDHQFSLTSRGLQWSTYERTVRLFNASQDWGPLLEAAGWSLHSDQRDTVARCRYWTRPGKKAIDGKSASTDYTSVDGTVSNLMTIYTNDPAVADLRDNGDELDVVGTCSKWRFAVSRVFAGDEITLLRCVAANGGRLT